MQTASKWKKAAFEIGSALSYWSIWYLGIIMLVHLVLTIMTKGAFDDFLAFSYLSAPLTFFIFGIIGGVSFLPELVKQGVTRKNAFIANVLGMALAVLFVIVVAAVVTMLERLVLGAMDASIVWEGSLVDRFLAEDLGLNSDLFSGAPAVQWLLAFLSYFLNLFFNYLVGWFISTSFYGRGFLAGMAAILMSIVLFIATDLFGESGVLYTVLSENLTIVGWNVTGVASLVGMTFLSAVLLLVIRLTTRRMPIKL